MTTYYVDGSTGSDSNNTTQAQSPSTPWLTIAHGLGNLNASGGDVLAIRDTGVYSISTGLTIADLGSPNAGTRIVGFTTTVGDGGRATIRTSAAVAGITLTGTNWMVSLEDLILDGNSTGTQGVVFPGASFCCSMVRCLVEGWTQEGVSSAGSIISILDTEVTGCGGTNGAIATSGDKMLVAGGKVHGNGAAGIYATSTVFAQDVRVYGNTGCGLNLTNWPQDVRGCTIDGNGSSGLKLQYCLAAQVSNNIFTANGAYGLEVSSYSGGIANPQIDYNWFGSGSLVNASGARSANLTAGPHDLSGDPQYVNAGTGDYTPQNAAVRAASNNGWIGAVQPTPSGGSSGPVGRSTIVQNIGTY